MLKLRQLYVRYKERKARLELVRLKLLHKQLAYDLARLGNEISRREGTIKF